MDLKLNVILYFNKCFVYVNIKSFLEIFKHYLRYLNSKLWVSF